MRLLACALLLGLLRPGARALSDSQLSANLERKLNETMSAHSVHYTPLNSTGRPNYRASTSFNTKGMRQLYNFTDIFIDFIQPKQAYPEGMIHLENGKPVLVDPVTEWRMIARHYGGLAGLGLAGLLLAAILPCVGLFFCCCRCAGHCGARSEPFDKKHDHCRKVMLNFMLIGFATLLLFGVVCAFVTNERMDSGARELPQAVQISLEDTKLYLKSTRAQLEILLKTNYEELAQALDRILQASGKIVTDQLAESSHAGSLMNLNYIVQGLDSIRTDLKMMNDITKQLRSNAEHLGIIVRRVKMNLLNTLTKCNTQDCKDVMHKYKINEMSVQVEFDKLPDNEVTDALRNISYLLDANIVEEVRNGMDQFMNIQKEIQHAVNETIPVVQDSIRRAGKSLAGVDSNVVQLIDRIQKDIDKQYIPQVDFAKRHIDQFSPYRYYLGLGISTILLVVLTCVVFGLFCGICGKRPDGYDDDCCDKGSGARFLMMAVWFIFLLTSILMIITVAHMITGVLVERAICEPLQNPNDNRMFEFVDKFLQIKKVLYPKNPDADINMSHILNSCHKNETIYQVLKMQYIIDVDVLRGYIDHYDINRTIHKLEEKINLSDHKEYKIISETARDKLNALAQSGLSDLKFYQYTENLKDNITSINLENLASKLRDLASRLSNDHQMVKEDLIKNAYDLEGYHRDIVVPMTNWSNQLSNSAMRLEEHIKFNHTSMSEAIHDLVTKVDKAQEFISKKGSQHVKTLAAEFGKAFILQVNNYLDRVIEGILKDVGKCGPLSNAYNATIVASCSKILYPFNGFWVSVGWCLILFIPTIVLCVKLSALYQKSDPYPGPLVESIHDKKYVAHSRHHGHHPGVGYHESYDGPAVGYSERERISEAHQSTSHHDSRYSDLAPKNWDFPNGGPPRYQPAAVAPPLSTEYERPPPYYYPGPGDRN